jgi:hypothetical protein
VNQASGLVEEEVAAGDEGEIRDDELGMDMETLAPVTRGDDSSPSVGEIATENLDSLSDEGQFEPQDFTYDDYSPATWDAGGDDGGGKPTSTARDLQSRFVLEEFPGPAGASVGVGNPTFNTFFSSSTNPSSTKPTLNTHQSVVDPELWELARWLMSSGLSAGARESFFKLKYVSNFLLSLGLN